MRSTLSHAALAALAVTAMFVTTPAFSDPAVSDPAAAPAVDRPERGLHMQALEARYGAPTTRYDAVGKPPITRWDYPTFIVYFEGDRVIHAVLVKPEG